MLDPDSRVIKVRTELPNNSGLLKPEMFASVVITSQVRKVINTIPQTAVVLENSRYFVMRELEPGKFEKVQVELGETFGKYYELLDGLNIGDRVVSEGSIFILTAYNRM